MQFRLTLTGPIGQLIPINYQYPLSACIYKIIERADAAYSLFLHNQGHHSPGRLKSFKLFTFSNLSMPCRRIDDRLQIQSNQAEMQIAFHIPETAEKFVIGIFKDQRVEIADKYSKAAFTVSQVEALPGLQGSIRYKKYIGNIKLQLFRITYICISIVFIGVAQRKESQQRSCGMEVRILSPFT